MEDVVASGANTKMLLLSATPVNNQLADLRNQISFIAGADVARDAAADRAFLQKLGIGSVKETTCKTQQQFTAKPFRDNAIEFLRKLGYPFYDYRPRRFRLAAHASVSAEEFFRQL